MANQNPKELLLIEREAPGPIAAIRGSYAMHGEMILTNTSNPNWPDEHHWIEYAAGYVAPQSVAAAIANSTAYSEGDVRVGTDGFMWICSKAGTSAASGNTLPTAPVDGQVFTTGTASFTYWNFFDKLPIGSKYKHLVLTSGVVTSFVDYAKVSMTGVARWKPVTLGTAV